MPSFRSRIAQSGLDGNGPFTLSVRHSYACLVFLALVLQRHVNPAGYDYKDGLEIFKQVHDFVGLFLSDFSLLHTLKYDE